MPAPHHHHQRRDERSGRQALYQRRQGKQGRLRRRVFLQRAVTLGLAAHSALALLAACDNQSASIDVLTVWSSEEQDSFRAVVAPFEQQTHIKVQVVSTRDQDTLLTTLLRANTPPGVAILPNPGGMQQLAAQGKLLPLDSFLDMEIIKRDYTRTWIDLGSYKGALYALFYKAANKGIIWYNPKQWQALGLPLPHTWDELIAVSNAIAARGRYPWAMGVESAASSGWPAADWIAELYLKEWGPEMYQRWVSHRIAWTDPTIKQTFRRFNTILNGKHYIQDAPTSVLLTNFQDASYAPFEQPPRAYFYYSGDFVLGFVTSRFPTIVPGEEINFFPFPAIDPRYSGAVTGGADAVVALQDTAEVRALVQYLASAQAQEIWVRRGGFTSVNRSVPISAYPNPVARASAQMLSTAPLFCFGAGDLMPPVVQHAFWKGMLAFIQEPDQLDTILESIEAVARRNYPD
ncbi:ABC transporter substrate-binding protein [Thermogemmatispora sp.]|uniref:ABC transporter substrate-binding protein n=1 Tax=Thermogemmatispora sp. TaxID=1968838 RepID=UPI001D710F7F|nr:ABC transporter substrate-binding protein [Thermogemmatispora sp.]MBX5450774.1 carbohydrate ABC transporter substrate-binding protein [Thermogemmatispora sp.]